MPTVEPGDLILVTGVSGFIAAHGAEAFLDAGYPVRGTVRSTAKGEYLKDRFKGKKQSFEYVTVSDIGEEGAFDEAVKGVDGVAHFASPFHFKSDYPEELIKPAVVGTVGICKSLQKNNPHVKRIVITRQVCCQSTEPGLMRDSSVAAVMDATVPAPHTFDEKDWNGISPKVCEEKGREADAANKYRASKTLAEQAFWKFFEDEKPAFDGVAINPPLVLGPIIHQCDKVEDLNTSCNAFYSWMRGEHKQSELPGDAAGNYIDVRDVATAHVRALEVEEASGQRYICGNGPHGPNDYCLVLNRIYPELKNVPKGDASVREKLYSAANKFDGSKCAKAFDIKYITLDQSIEDMARELKQRFGP